MQIRQLKQFLALADSKYFNTAAEKVGLTQSALTQAIAKLEKELGVQLFVRSKTGSILTQEGECLREHARIILAQVGAAEAELRVRSQEVHREIRFGVIKSLSDEVISEIFGAFIQKYPSYNIRIIKGWSSSLLEMLAQGEVDFAFVSDHFLYVDGHQFHSKPLFADTVKVVVAGNHPLASRPEVSIKDLSHYRWVVVTISAGQRAALARSFSSADTPPPSEILETNSSRLSKHLINSGDYVGLASPNPLLWEVSEIANLKFLDVPELNTERQFSLYRRSRMVLRPAHEYLLDHFEQVISTSPHRRTAQEEAVTCA